MVGQVLTNRVNIFPAGAGVNLAVWIGLCRWQYIPRESGDEPNRGEGIRIIRNIPDRCDVNLMLTVSIDITIKAFLVYAWKTWY